MKNLKYLLFLPFVFFATGLHGDIILVDTTPAKICVRIINLNKFPDMAVIGLSDCLAFSNSNKAFRIKNNSCLNASNACPLTLYVMKTDYFNKIDVNTIDWGRDKNVQKLNLTINAKSFYTRDYKSLDIDFNLAIRNNTYYLYKSKMTWKYRDERQDSIKHFNNNAADPFKPISVPRENEPR